MINFIGLRRKARHVPKCVLVLIASAYCAGCESKTDRYRQRITVEVETPQGLRVGSSVTEVEWSYRSGFGEQGGSRARALGEAVAVQLPNRHTLFALLTRTDDYDWIESAASRAVSSQIPEEEKGLGGYYQDHYLAGEFKPKDYPTLIHYRDIRDARTVEVVDPSRLDKYFGPGTKLKRISLQITDDGITRGIVKLLPSFKDETGYKEWYERLPYLDGRAVTLDNLSRER